MVLISTFSASDRSSLPSSSMLSKSAHHDAARSLHSAPGPVDSRNHTASHAGNKTDSCSTQQAGSNGLLRVVGPGKVVVALSSSGSGGGEGEKLIDFVALKSTG